MQLSSPHYKALDMFLLIYSITTSIVATMYSLVVEVFGILPILLLLQWFIEHYLSTNLFVYLHLSFSGVYV